MLILDPTPDGRDSVLGAVQAAAREANYLASIVMLPVADSGRIATAAQRLRKLDAKGILVLAPSAGAIEALRETAGTLPVVAMGAGPHDGVPTVAADHFSGAAAATRHLLDLGHRTVFHVAGPPGQHDATLRLDGWRKTLLSAGAEIPPPLRGDWTPAAGYALGRRLARRDDATAIFVAGDQMALGLLRALHELERRVPEEVSIIGFDGAPNSEFFTPPLTTVRENFAEMGRYSFELLRREIELGGQPRIHHTIATELVVRASTMPVASRATAAAVSRSCTGAGRSAAGIHGG